MIFEQLLFQAKEGDLESITDILNMYRPLLLKYSVIDGRLDEDLYQEQYYIDASHQTVPNLNL